MQNELSSYKGSALVERARIDGHVSFLDVDGTIASYLSEPTLAEVEARREIREMLDAEGGVVFNTMRTPELCMSEAAFKASKAAGFNRKEPLCHVDQDKRQVYRSLNTLLKYSHNLDPHAISNPGTGIWVYRNGAYYPDVDFFTRHRVEKDKWKTNVLSLLAEVDIDNAIRSTFSELEDPENYSNGRVDVEPLECRFEIKSKPDMTPEEGKAWKRFVRDRLNSLRGTNHSLAKVAHSIECIDESNPLKNKYQLYLVPKRLTKEGSSNRILLEISKEMGVPTREFTCLSAGDTMTDLKAGLFGGYDCRGYFILAGGSRLTEYLIGSKKGQPFAGQSLTSIVRRLKPTGKKGWYVFYMWGMQTPRIVIIADEAIKGDKTDAESVLGVLKEFRQQ